MTTDHRAGSTGGADQHGQLHGGPDDDYTPEQLAAMDRTELDRVGARYDGVEVLHVDPVPPPGSALDKRNTRQVTIWFGLAALFALAFVVIYAGSGWFLPSWRWEVGSSTWSALFTPMLGALFGAAMISIGIGLVLYVKKLLPHETAVQDKHDGSHFDRVTTGATLMSGLDNSGLPRRKMLGRTLGLLGVAVGAMLIAPLGGFLKNPNKGNPLGTTPWGNGVRMVRDDGTPIRPGDQVPGSMATVFPAVPGGDRAADAAVLLIRLRPEQTAVKKSLPGEADFGYADFLAYSKICTHAGCPVSLYEQETSKLLCPCHQSQFLVTDGAKPVFGPATRPLPQLPIAVDDEGYFIARNDFPAPVGPSFWNIGRLS